MPKNKNKTKKCFLCGKSLRIYDPPCRCEKMFCVLHRQLEQHGCPHLQHIRDAQREKNSKIIKAATDKSLVLDY